MLDYSHRLNSGYDESEISQDVKNVLNDAVQNRAHLEKDPLQSKD